MVEAYFTYSSSSPTDPGERRTEADEPAQAPANVFSDRPERPAAESEPLTFAPAANEPASGADEQPERSGANGQAGTAFSSANLNVSPVAPDRGNNTTAAPEPSTAAAAAPNGATQEATSSPASNVSTNGALHAPDGRGDSARDAVETLYTGPFPNFSADALDCLDRAAKLAYDLNHTCISSAHLLLAMTLDQRSRKMLERVGDVGQLRQGAMQVIGKMHWRYSEGRGDAEPLPGSVTADLWDIFEEAKREADDRQQDVSVADLIRAFPKGGPGEQLTYGAEDEYAAVPQVIDRVEKGLTPRLTDFMMNFEYQLQQRTQQILEGILNEFGAELRDRLSTVIAAAQPRPVPSAPPPATPNYPVAGTAPSGMTTAIPPRAPEPEERPFLERLFGRGA